MRQWLMVGLVIAGLGLGAWGITRYAPPEGAAVGNRVADFRLQRLPQGDSVNLRAAYDGQVVLVNLWATWCVPCRKEMPSMERLYQAYKDRGFRIAAISLDQGDSTAVLAFTRSLALSFDILQDRSNLSQQTYQAVGVPHSLIVGRDGKVAYVALGSEEWDSPANRARIDSLLGPAR